MLGSPPDTLPSTGQVHRQVVGWGNKPKKLGPALDTGSHLAHNLLSGIDILHGPNHPLPGTYLFLGQMRYWAPRPACYFWVRAWSPCNGGANLGKYIAPKLQAPLSRLEVCGAYNPRQRPWMTSAAKANQPRANLLQKISILILIKLSSIRS